MEGPPSHRVSRSYAIARCLSLEQSLHVLVTATVTALMQRPQNVKSGIAAEPSI